MLWNGQCLLKYQLSLLQNVQSINIYIRKTKIQLQLIKSSQLRSDKDKLIHSVYSKKETYLKRNTFLFIFVVYFIECRLSHEFKHYNG